MQDRLLATILAEPPNFHDYKDQLISYWRIDDKTCFELNSRLKAGMKTLETGAGLSTVIFAASGCDHTCIMPSAALADRIQSYCRSADIDTGSVRFVIAKSADAMPQIDRATFDLILIDGSHNFPTVFVDFYYAARALKLGGTLIIDDLHIYTCRLAARFMRSDPGWNMDFINERVAFGRKISDTIDYEWTKQPFVERRSPTDRPHASLLRPLVTTQIVAEMVQMQGGRATARRIANSILRRVGLR
jgi:hypothetical protein